METKPTIPNAPVETFNPDVQDLEVKRIEYAEENLLGPVVVGGCASADCFIPHNRDRY